MKEETPVQAETEQETTINDGTPEKLSGEEKISSKEEELQEKTNELNDRYLRLAADFENYKKRNARETEQRISYAVEQIAIEMLDITDNLEKALLSDDDSLREGLKQTYKLLISMLESHSITPIESINQTFDPTKQEALAYVPSDYEEGTVIDEITRGYYMKDKVIRCAKVAVSQGKNKEE